MMAGAWSASRPAPSTWSTTTPPSSGPWCACFGAGSIEAVAWDGAAAFLAGQGALAPPTCAVLDLRMPGMDGIQLQEELAARGVTCPVVFLSAHADVPTTVRAVKAGAVDFLLKPFVPDQFVAVVRAAMERSTQMMRDGQQAERFRAAMRISPPARRRSSVSW